MTFAAPRVGDLKYALEFGEPTFMQLEGIEWSPGSFVASTLKGFDELFIQVRSQHDLRLFVSTGLQQDTLNLEAKHLCRLDMLSQSHWEYAGQAL